jgi:hypothetical protein
MERYSDPRRSTRPMSQDRALPRLGAARIESATAFVEVGPHRRGQGFAIGRVIANEIHVIHKVVEADRAVFASSIHSLTPGGIDAPTNHA